MKNSKKRAREHAAAHPISGPSADEMQKFIEFLAPEILKPEIEPNPKPTISKDEFLLWEARARGVDFKVQYADIADGNLNAGILLSQIVFWFLPSKSGKRKTTVIREERHWIAKSKDAWYQETRLKKWAFDSALKVLIEKGIVDKRVWNFHNLRTLHLSLNLENFLQEMALAIAHTDDDQK